MIMCNFMEIKKKITRDDFYCYFFFSDDDFPIVKQTVLATMCDLPKQAFYSRFFMLFDKI